MSVVVPADLAAEDRKLWEALGEAKPRWTHWPTPGAKHELEATRMALKALDQDLLPWQAWVIRLLTEKRPDSPRYRFSEFLLTVPRQSGKTTMVRGVLLARMILYPRRQCFYTAQTGKDAGERWKDLCERIIVSPIAKGFDYKRGAGHERLTFTRNLSRLSPFAPSPTSLHGYTPHDVALDEIFAFDVIRGNELMGAIKPAQQTLPDRQLIQLSTAGGTGSTFLREKVELGRSSAETGQDTIGYVEWSLPNDADPYDESLWSFHPSLGHLIDMEDLRELAKSTPRGEWQRAFLNQWVEGNDPLFAMEKWNANVETLEKPSPGDCVFGFSISNDRRRAAIVAAWNVDDRIAVKVIKSTQDIGTFTATVADLFDLKPVAVAADNGGNDKGLIDEVNRQLPSHRKVESLSAADWVLASLGFQSLLENGTLMHDGDPYLTSAIANARSKSMGEAWAISHASAPEVVAAVAAVRILEAKPRKKANTEVYFG